MTIEPIYYLPVIPMILVNGGRGIGTAFSTYIPNFCPKQIISYLKNILQGKPNKKPLIPHFNGFNGTITCLDENYTKFETSGNY